MRQHEIDQLVVAPFGIVEAEFIVGRALAPQKIARRDAHAPDQINEASRGRAASSDIR